jgi:coenzyme F420-reducing hydrogenase gamma subunit
MSSKTKPRIAVLKFASCDGCQLSLLDAEDELLEVAGLIEIACFPEASRAMRKGPYDIALVEGSITTHHDAERMQDIRRKSKTLITIGACATTGGIQALRNWKDIDEFIRVVYATPQYISTLKLSTPIAEHVPVDFDLRGCPISKYQLIEVIAAKLAGRKPNIPTCSVCLECKCKANVCIAITRGAACLGPVTQASCGALCPSYGRACFGCYRPHGEPQYGFAGESVPNARTNRRSAGTIFSWLQRVGIAVPQGQRRSVNGHGWEDDPCRHAYPGGP